MRQKPGMKGSTHDLILFVIASDYGLLRSGIRSVSQNEYTATTMLTVCVTEGLCTKMKNVNIFYCNPLTETLDRKKTRANAQATAATVATNGRSVRRCANKKDKHTMKC